MSFAGVGCGRSVHGFASISQAADVFMDFPHDVQLHPPADMATWRTHEQPILYQAAKLGAFFTYHANDLILKEKFHIGGIFNVRGYSDVFHMLTV